MIALQRDVPGTSFITFEEDGTGIAFLTFPNALLHTFSVDVARVNHRFVRRQPPLLRE